MPIPAFILPLEARRDFSKPRGVVYSGDITGLLEEARDPLFCIGDVVSQYCMKTGKEHVVLVVDWKTRRHVGFQERLPAGYTVRRVRNPPGTVTFEAMREICRLAREKGKWILVVDGEEDMLALPALACLQDGGTVVYGVPLKGATIIHVGLDTSREAQARFLELRPGLALLE